MSHYSKGPSIKVVRHQRKSINEHGWTEIGTEANKVEILR